jgi:hypothetical protein
MKFKHNPLAIWLPPYTSSKVMARAHNKILALVKLKVLPHPSTLPCVICNNRAPNAVYHHHKSYFPPDDTNVVVMCRGCHAKVHNLTLEF